MCSANKHLSCILSTSNDNQHHGIPLLVNPDLCPHLASPLSPPGSHPDSLGPPGSLSSPPGSLGSPQSPWFSPVLPCYFT